MATQTIYPAVESSDEAVSQDLRRIIQHAEVSSADAGVNTFPEDRARHVPAGSGAAYWGPGSLMTFIVTGKETGGAFSWLKCRCLRAEAHRRTSTSARTNRFMSSKGRSHFGWATIQSLHRRGILLSFPVGSNTPSRIMAM